MEIIKHGKQDVLNYPIVCGSNSCISYLTLRNSTMVEHLCNLLLSGHRLYNAKVEPLSVVMPAISTIKNNDIKMNAVTISFKLRDNKYYNIILFYCNQSINLEYRNILQFIHDNLSVYDYNGNQVLMKDATADNTSVDILLLHNNNSTIINMSNIIISNVFGNNTAVNNIVTWSNKSQDFYSGLFETFELLEALLYNKCIQYEKFNLDIIAKEVEYLSNISAGNLSSLLDISSNVFNLSNEK